MKIRHIINYNNIGFWIILFFVLRLYGITNPPLEVSHNWRQTNVAMVARNFLEVDANIFYPRIDVAGEKSGITGMEFPIFNYLIYLFSLILGYQHWYGRLINLVVSSFGMWFFYRLVNVSLGKRVAFNATIVLLVSIWFNFSRKVMPDTFSMSLVIIGMYYGFQYLKEKAGPGSLILYAIFTMLGVLSKLPSGYILILFLFLLFSHDIQFKRKKYFAAVSVIMLIPPMIWYFYWVPHLVEEYDFWYYYMGKSIPAGSKEIIDNLPRTLQRFYDSALKFSGFVLFAFGIVKAIQKKDRLLLSVFGSGFLAFLVVILKAGFAFPHHNYYIIPFVPMMALMAGYGIAQIKNRNIIIAVLLIIAIEGILNRQHDFRINDDEKPMLSLEADLDKFTSRNDLILINSGQQPTPMYFAHRKGWLAENDEIINKDYIADLQKKGLKAIVVIKKKFGSEINLDYQKVFENDSYVIYKL